MSARDRSAGSPAEATSDLGAHVGRRGTTFRAWTTLAERMSVMVRGAKDGPWLELPMEPLGDGVHEVISSDAGPGSTYRFKLNDRELPDPYARFVPEGVHGPAEVVEPSYRWTTSDWDGLGDEKILYELHVGTFTSEGTYRAAVEKLPELASLGVTAVELMPLSSAAGRRGWGYDGVAHFAPFPPYGTPDELRELVDACHALGIGVILDVVYNHFGPAGNYLGAYSPDYFTKKFRSPWGDAPNYANPRMRRFVVANALYWLTEFRIDGLRLDAIHEIPDGSQVHILTELSQAVKRVEGPRRVLFAEDDRNDPSAITKHGIDVLWSDDFHHDVHVLLTGERDGYYRCYERSVEELARTIRRGWLYEGQLWPLSGKPRGRPREPLDHKQLVYSLQNHDQVGNRPWGERLGHLTSQGAYASAAMLLLFLPSVPLLFMGQEWAASSPFCYFTDHEPELGMTITQGRRQEFAHFTKFGADGEIPDPQAESTFMRSKLDWSEREREPHASSLRLYRLLLSLRRTDTVLRGGRSGNLSTSARAQVLCVERWQDDDRRWLFVNFGPDTTEIGLRLADKRLLVASSTNALVGNALLGHAAILVASSQPG